VETAWLRREDSNLRMGDSKSGGAANDINAYSEQGSKSICGYINGLSSISDRAAVIGKPERNII
jgi:hypothetical protein